MDTLELLKKARSGDRVARNQLVEQNVGLVWNIVKRFHGRGYEADDIFQIGCIGLIKAIDHFDLSYDVKFSKYAVPMITGQIKRFLRDDGMIKVSRTLKENGWKIHQAGERLHHELGRSATVDEIAAATELEREEIVMALEANREVGTIDRMLYQESGKEMQLIDQVVQMPGNRIGSLVSGQDMTGVLNDSEKERVLDHMLVKQLLESLEERERRLIEYRYFDDMTQSQVAEKLHISQVQVSRLEKKILLKLRGESGLA